MLNASTLLQPLHRLFRFLVVLLFAAAAFAHAASAQTLRSEYVRITGAYATADAVLHSSSQDDKSVAFLYTHPFAPSSLSGFFCSQIPRRGLAVLCMNNRFSNNQQLNTIWEPIALDVAAGVGELRKRGYQKVFLLGYSAGGPTMAYFQALAEQGNALFNGGAALSGFKGFFERDGSERRVPAADGLILLNPSSGIGASGMFRLDPAIVDEASGQRDPSIDMYLAANGFDEKTGRATYTAEFLKRFRQAQCDRMNRLIDQSLARVKLARDGQSRFQGDDVAVTPGLRANPAYADLSLAQSTKGAYRLFPDDVTTVVKNDRVVARQAARNRGVDETARTDLSFLSYRAVRCSHFDADATDPDAHGLDVRSSNNITYANLARTRVPLLVIQGTADDTISHLTIAELLFNASTAPDKSLWYVKGMTHAITALRAEHGDVPSITADALVRWVRDRQAGRATTQRHMGNPSLALSVSPSLVPAAPVTISAGH